jgi:hypothetical protein
MALAGGKYDMAPHICHWLAVDYLYVYTAVWIEVGTTSFLSIPFLNKMYWTGETSPGENWHFLLFSHVSRHFFHPQNVRGPGENGRKSPTILCQKKSSLYKLYVDMGRNGRKF